MPSLKETIEKMPKHDVIKVNALEGKLFDILSCDFKTLHSEQYGDSETAICDVQVGQDIYVVFFRQKYIYRFLKRLFEDELLELPLTGVTVRAVKTKVGNSVWIMEPYSSE